jgi:cytochrome P450
MSEGKHVADLTGPVTVDDDFFQHPHDVLAQLPQESPVRRIRLPEGDGWLITRYAEAKAVVADPRITRDTSTMQRMEQARARASGQPVIADEDDELAWLYRWVLLRDPPDHTRLRKLANKAFTPGAVERLRPRIEKITDDLLDRISGPGVIDLMPSFAVPLPMAAISAVLGIPDEDNPDFWTWSHVINGAFPDPRQSDVAREAVQYLGALAERKRADPGPDLMSDMVRAQESGEYSREEVISMAMLLLMAGHDTTVSLIANGTLALLRAPDQLALLRSDPAMLPDAVEEILRYDCPVNISPRRVTLEPIEIGGVTIPAGESLFVSVLAANRDPGQFDNPAAFDITRKTDGHLGFLHGIHFCLGAPLARLEGRIALGRLFGRFPDLRLATDPETLTYRDSTLMHALAELPVYLTGPAPRTERK